MKLDEVPNYIDAVFKGMKKVVIGQDEVIKQMLTAIVVDAHAILEGYPGLAKTLSVKTLARLLDLRFSRIQNTPDLMPSDILGTYLIEDTKGTRELKFQQGPVFANIVLADEINRATPKTQSALLEAMQERQVTVGKETYKLDRPFFVLATQNPIEQEGTYPLPEAQTDRFLFKIKTEYPSFDEEMEIVEKYSEVLEEAQLKPVLKREDIADLQNLARKIPIANDLKKFALDIVTSTRKKKDLIEYGASPRASIGLILAAKGRALIEGRKHVSREDIVKMAFPVLRHRIVLSFEAERNNITPDDVIKILTK
ncbi:MAG TPA: MoxR family ATPase [Candidatus Nanoarchaeia archaeon]|nr:MoxR family ATPase [Candidatus Nanoarchaeia archaeon]